MKNIWNSHFTPMLLKEIDKPFNSKNHLYEIKYDGIRALTFVTPKTIKIISRNNQDLTSFYPELQDIKNIVKTNVIFDGEIIAMDNEKISFSKLSERSHLKDKNKILHQSKDNPVIFIAFDILYENKNLVDQPLIKRKELLNNYPDTSFFLKSKYISTDGIKLFNSIKKLNMEGIVAKEKNSIYEINKRVDTWVKIKNIKDNDFFIGGYIKNKANYTISLILGEYRNNLLCYVGKVILGKKRELYSKIIKETPIKKTPFIDFDDPNVIYIKPNILCTVMYTEITKNGHLRHPVVK